MTATVISHFYNEQYLLPWWLKHHVRIFDHGVLIDYGSTDDSVEICRRLAPSWLIIPSRNAHFSAADCDEEVMEIERQVPGWKIALNTTEFLCCDDMPGLQRRLEADGRKGAWIRAAVMADPTSLADVEPCRDKPLVAQRQFGHYHDERRSSEVGRDRLLHRGRHGAYQLGRHDSFHSRGLERHPPEALVLWYAYSPWTSGLRTRKLQIGSRLPLGDVAIGLGKQHLLAEEALRGIWATESQRSRDLSLDPDFARVVGATLQAPAGSASQSARLSISRPLRRRTLLPRHVTRARAIANLLRAYVYLDERQFTNARRAAAAALVGPAQVRKNAIVTVLLPRLAAALRARLQG